MVIPEIEADLVVIARDEVLFLAYHNKQTSWYSYPRSIFLRRCPPVLWTFPDSLFFPGYEGQDVLELFRGRFHH